MAKVQEIPAYLQSEEAFKSVANYEQRKSVVSGNERKYGVSGKYTGETHQNLAVIRYLQDNPRARSEWEARLGITQAALSSLRHETQGKRGFFGRIFGGGEKRSIKDVAASNNYFAKETRGTGEINAQGGKAIEASEKERMFMDINNELVKAWRKDIGSRLITGGLLGMIQSRTSNLNKALRTIESKYPGTGNAIIGQLQAHFAQINELSKAAGANTGTKRGLEFAAGIVGGTFGWENQATLQKIQSNPRFTGRLNAFLQVAIGAAVSSAMGSPSIYLGSINTGIKMKDIRNANKDVISNALFGTSYNTILQENDREHGRYNRMLGDNAITAETRGNLETYRASVSGNAGEYEEAADEGFKATGGLKLFRVLGEIFTKTARETITDPYTPLEKKYEVIDREIVKLGDKKQTDNVRAQIMTLQRLKTLYGRREQGREHVERDTLPAKYQEALRVMNRFATYDEIKDFYMPRSTKESMKTYLEGGRGYAARDKNLLIYLWDSVDTPGFQKFIKTVASGKTREFNEWTLQQEGHDAGSKRGKEYGQDISSIKSAAELSLYLDSLEGGRRLASIYAAQINNLGKNISVDPDEIVRASYEAQYGVSGGLFNSGRNSADINKLKTYNGNGWSMDVRATDMSEGYPKSVLLHIGVKPNCSNLLIGDIVGNRWVDTANLSSDLNLRIPVSVQIPKSNSQEAAPKETVEKATPVKKSVAPTRDAPTPRPTRTPPMKPPVKPPVKPRTPSAGSRPVDGGVTNNTGGTGIVDQSPGNAPLQNPATVIDSTSPVNNLVNPVNPAIVPPTSTLPSGNVPGL